MADVALGELERGRGRTAKTPVHIPPRGWWDILKRTWSQIEEDRLLAISGGIVFYMLLALFPAIGAFISIYGLFTDPLTARDHLDLLAAVAPPGTTELISEQIERIAGGRPDRLSLGVLVGFGVSLWSANAGVKALFDALNVVYGEKEKRSFIRLNALSLLFTACAILFLLIAIGGVIVLPLVLERLWLSNMAEDLIFLARWPVIFLVLTGGLALVYRFGPSRENPTWRWVSVGSLVASFMFITASVLFSWYLSNVTDYNRTYGSLGAFMGVMIWLWIANIAVLLGGELNAEIEHQTAVDTTTGPDRPMGERGAYVADTLGPVDA